MRRKKINRLTKTKIGYIKNRVQCFNPRGQRWVKVNTKTGCIEGHKKRPYKNIRKRYRKLGVQKKKKVKRTKYCCDMMAYAMGEAGVIGYSVLPTIAHIEIDYCPWCRKKLKSEV